MCIIAKIIMYARAGLNYVGVVFYIATVTTHAVMSRDIT